MDIERRGLICFMLGYISKHYNCDFGKALDVLNDILPSLNQMPLQQSENEYLKDLGSEIDFFILSLFNRDQQRKLKNKYS